MENLEKYVFWTSDNEKLYHAKQELVSLVNRFPIHITAKGFFIVDRRFLAAVICVRTKLNEWLINMVSISRWSLLAARI